MKVSVVIPAYNEAERIGVCLGSLMKQKIKADEIIVVNNNSKDKTAEVVSKYPVKMIDQPIKGIIPTRNKGFDTAQNDLILRCDADCIVPENWIEQILTDFGNNDIDGLSGPVIFYDLQPKSAFFSNVFTDFMRMIQHFETMIGPNMALKKNIWNKIRDSVCMNDKLVHEDIDLAYHIHKTGGKIMFDKHLVVNASGRRIKNNPISFFGEYPIRLIKTLNQHK